MKFASHFIGQAFNGASGAPRCGIYASLQQAGDTGNVGSFTTLKDVIIKNLSFKVDS